MMKKSVLIILMCMGFTNIAFADVSERAEAVKASVEGKSGYHAEMAKGLVDVAEEELSQDDAAVARGFMDEAEKHAKQVGGK